MNVPPPRSGPALFFALVAGLTTLGCVTETRLFISDRPASVEGRVALDGPIPRSWRAPHDRDAWPGALDAPPPGWDGTPPNELEVTAAGGVRGVAVWLEEAGKKPDGGERKNDEFRSADLTRDFVLQGSCFWPMTAVIPVGGSVRFENRDVRSHHIHFLSNGPAIDVVVGAGATEEVRLERAGRYRLTCNDHAFMRADLIVAPSRGSAVTDGEGRFLIENVPGGHYLVRFAHHRLAEVDPAPVVILGGGGRAFVELRARRGDWND